MIMVEKKTREKKPAKKSTVTGTDERVRDLEMRIKELETERRKMGQKAEPKEESIVGGVVGQMIPGLGNIVKILENSSPEFRKKIADTDVEIKHRIETGWGGAKPIADYGISIRPFQSHRAPAAAKVRRMPMEGVEPPEKEPIIDVFEEKKHISVIAELPGVSEKAIKTRLEDKTLEITAGKHKRTVALPSQPGKIKEQTFKNGILHLVIEKKPS
jgi:HSP20 family protein